MSNNETASRNQRKREEKKDPKKAFVGEDLIKWGMNSTRQTVDSLTLIMNVLVFFFLFLFLFFLFFFLSTYHDEIPLYLYI